MRDKNSSRVFESSRNTPSIVLVIVLLFIFCTPRITMHMCLWQPTGRQMRSGNKEKNGVVAYVASITTPTPAGLIASVIATAICFVSLSCTVVSVNIPGQLVVCAKCCC